MIGTKTHRKGRGKALAEAYAAVCGRLDVARDTAQELLEGLAPGLVAKVTTGMAAAERCADLERRFKVVTLDVGAKRTIKARGEDRRSHEFQVPLVFTARLPAKPVVELTVENRQHARATLKTNVPQPPTKALLELDKHGAKFDHCEVWWVPRDFESKVVDPDPILVGTIVFPEPDVKGCLGTYGCKPPAPKAMHFELYRWDDAGVEHPYWAREAY